MRAAFLVWDVLEDAEDPGPALRGLAQSGLCPVVIAPECDESTPRLPGVEFAVITTGRSRPDCWADTDGLLVRAATHCDVALGEAFVVCGTAADVSTAAEAGCRPVLVLGSMSLDDVFGAVEPKQKDAASAPDLDTAVRYMIEEARQESVVGPFPYAERVPVEGHVQTVVPSARDLAAVFALVSLAGLAVALGIAYLLQEIYQRAAFPPIAYWLTLQFIPQTWRGVLFVAIGVAAGLLVRPMISRLTGRYRARRT